VSVCSLAWPRCQGNFARSRLLLRRYSGSNTRGRNSGIFWGLLQCSLLIGSMLAYAVVPGGKDISRHTATKLYSGLLVICCTGAATLTLLGKPPAVGYVVVVASCPLLAADACRVSECAQQVLTFVRV
jgi:hypothetical protein